MRRFALRRCFAGLCLLMLWLTGCAAFRPMHGLPARYLPTEMKLGDRTGRRTIDLSLLRQPWSPHRIDTGDVLGIYIEGVVGKASDPPPVHFPQNNEIAPSFGLPFPVRDDGTISLPFVGAVSLRGLSVEQAEQKVIQAYLEPKEILKLDTLRVQVNLQRPRQYRVLVIRQDSKNEPQPNAMLGQVNLGMVKRGTGKIVNLPAYSNDVLNALTLTDGLPGLDAENAVYVIRRRGQLKTSTIDPNWTLDFDPSKLIQQSVDRKEPTIRGQSPYIQSPYSQSRYGQSRYSQPPSSPSSFGSAANSQWSSSPSSDEPSETQSLHIREMLQSAAPTTQSSEQSAPGADYVDNLNGQNAGPLFNASPQSSAIWPQTRVIDSMHSTGGSGQDSYVTETAGTYPVDMPGSTNAMTPTPIGAGSYGQATSPPTMVQTRSGNPGASAPQQYSTVTNPSAQAYSSQRYAERGYSYEGNSGSVYSAAPIPNQDYRTAGQQYPGQGSPAQSYRARIDVAQGSPYAYSNPSNQSSYDPPLAPRPDPNQTYGTTAPAPPNGMIPNYTLDNGAGLPWPAYVPPPVPSPYPSPSPSAPSTFAPPAPSFPVVAPQSDNSGPPIRRPVMSPAIAPLPAGIQMPMGLSTPATWPSQSSFTPGHGDLGDGLIDGRHVIRIPIRLGPGEVADVRPEDVILYDGDIVFIESRDTEVYFTGGLLGGGQYMLPRDYDLDILQAISLAQSRSGGMIGNAIGGVSALNNDVAISPSTAIILRKLPGGGELPIKVDLYRAREDLSERIYIQPGDFILLQYTPLEAIAAFFERHLLETALFSLAAQQFNKTGTN